MNNALLYTFVNFSHSFMLTKLPLRKILVHALAWAAFIFYEVSIALILNPSGTLWWEYIGYYLLNISLFYLNAHVLFFYAFKARKPVYLLLLFVPLELALYILVEFGLANFYHWLHAAAEPVLLDKVFTLSYLWRGIYFIGLSTGYWFALSTVEKTRKISQLKVQQAEGRREKAELEKNLALSQNAYLRAQINPHFLFNTLNFIYNTVQDVSPKASEGVMLLSEVMHYALGPVQEDGKADLAREVAHIRKYIALNQLRFSKPLQLSLQLEGRFSLYRFPPLLLLTFVENMFKHGILNDPAHPATVAIKCADAQLHFFVKNEKRTSYIKTELGIGIRNVEARLREHYQKEAFCLDIQEDDLYYVTNLRIELI